MFKLIWKREVIDEFETLKEAELMRSEYVMAFNDGNIKITEVLNNGND